MLLHLACLTLPASAFFPVQMFREAAVLSRLNHPCVVRFWGVVPVEELKPQQDIPQRSFARFSHSPGDSASSLDSRAQVGSRSRSKLSLGLVLDRCDGSLEDVLQHEPLLPLLEALHIAERIACGLKYLHSEAPLRVAHGDLKPANVLLKHGTDLVQLTDLGLTSTLAVHTMSMRVQNLQVAGVASGQSGWSLHWAAPELLAGYENGDETDPTCACDVYAFGLVLYQLLVGKMPYAGMFMSPKALKSGVMGGARPSWDGLEGVRGGEATPDVLSKMQALVEACWAHEARERPTAQQVQKQLVELQHEPAICQR
jgi:serine/threonine protein kinase